MAVLKHDTEYPIYTVEVSDKCVAVGGGSDGGFIGVPLFLYSYSYSNRETPQPSEEVVAAASSNKDPRKENKIVPSDKQTKQTKTETYTVRK